MTTTVLQILAISSLLLGCAAETATSGADDLSSSNTDVSISEEVGMSKDPILGGTSIAGSEPNGVLKVIAGLRTCSGVLMNNGWALTAKECLAGASTVSLTHQTASGNDVKTFNIEEGTNLFSHETLNVSLIKLPDGSPFAVNGSYWSLYNHIKTDLAADNASVTCYGYGRQNINPPYTIALRKSAGLVFGGSNSIFGFSSSKNPYGEDLGGPCFVTDGGRLKIIGIMLAIVGGSSGVQVSITPISFGAWVNAHMYSSGWQPISNSYEVTSAPAAVGVASDQYHIFARSNWGSMLFKRYVRGQGWEAWQDLGGGFRNIYNPAAATNASGQSLVFGRGNDDAVWFARMTQSTKTMDWCSLGGPTNGQIVGAPAATGLLNGRVMVFAEGTDGGLWYREQTGDYGCSGWGSWTSLGGSWPTSEDPEYYQTWPSAASFAAGRAHVTMCSRSACYYRYYSGVWDAGWTDIGGQRNWSAGKSVSVTSTGYGKLDVVGYDANSGVCTYEWYGNWPLLGEPGTGRACVGGAIAGRTAAASWGTGKMDIFVAGQDWRIWTIGSWFGL